MYRLLLLPCGVQAQSTRVAADTVSDELRTSTIHFAQRYKRFEMGVAAGATLNELYTQTIRSLSKYEMEMGGSLSALMLCRIANWYAFEWELSGIQKNYFWKHSNFGYQTTYNTYVQLPVMQRFSFGWEQTRFFVNLGGFGGYLFSRWESGRLLNVYDQSNYYSYSGKGRFDSRRDQRFELGVLAGAGMEYLSKERYRFFAEVRYFHGLTNLQQENYMLNQIPRYNNTFLFQMGCFFQFKTKKIPTVTQQIETIVTDYQEKRTEVKYPLNIGIDTIVVENTDGIEEVIDYQSVGEAQNKQDSVSTQCVLEKGYYIQLFALKFRRTIPYVRRTVPVLEEDRVVECQKNDFYVYLIGAFSTKEEAEKKLKHYKQELRGAFILIKK